MQIRKAFKQITLASAIYPILACAALFTPSQTNAATFTLHTRRFNHTATLLPNSNYLIIGGSSTTFVNTIEIFNSASGAIQEINPGNMLVQRSSHTATLLGNGKVLVAGGDNNLSNAFIYTPDTNTISPSITMTPGRMAHTATLLKNGKVLIVGGRDGADAVVSAALIYDPASGPNGAFSSAGNSLAARWGHTATLLSSGYVFVTGGYNGSRYIETTEIYNPNTNTWSPGPTLIRYRAYHTATTLNNGFVLISGGYDGREYVDTTEKYDQTSNTIVPAKKMSARNSYHTSTLYPDGTVHLIGGLGNIATNYFNGPFTVADSTITVVPTGSSYTEGTFSTVNISTVSLVFDQTLDVPVTGKFVNAALLVPPSVVNSQDAAVNISSSLLPVGFPPGFTLPVTLHSDLNGKSVYKGKIKGPVPLDKPYGTVSFIPQTAYSVANDLTKLWKNCTFNFTGTIAAGASADLDASSCKLFLKVPFPLTDYLHWGGLDQSQVLRILATMTGGAITASDRSVVPTTGTASELSADATISLNPSTLQPEATIALTFSGILGTITNTSSGDISAGTVNNVITALNLNLEYIVSPITVTGLSLNTMEQAPLSIQSMFFADDVSYDPSAAAWTFNDPMGYEDGDGTPHVFPAANHTALLTPNSDVIVAGGKDCANTTCSSTSAIDKFDIFISSLPAWASDTAMGSARGQHTTTLLANGKVLAIGGTDGLVTHKSAEIYDPDTKAWTAAKTPMAYPRSNHTATLLPNGTVLVAGGYTQGATTGTIAAAEVYYPAYDSWSVSSTMTVARQNHSALIIPSGGSAGNVMVIGGYSNGAYLNSYEVYIATKGIWQAVAPTAPTNTPVARAQHTATILLDGRILVAGGVNEGNGTLDSAQIYDPVLNRWTTVSAMNHKRHSHTATLLRNGKVLIAGGDDGGGEISDAEIFDPSDSSWTPASGMSGARLKHTATLLPNGKVLITGGVTALQQAMQTTEVYDPEFDIWRTAENLSAGRGYHTALVLRDGNLLAAGGYDGTKYINSTEKIYFTLNPDEKDPPTKRQPGGVSTDIATFDHIGTVTLRSGTSNFYGITEASGGNGGSANSSHSHPRVYLYMTDNPSGFMLDLSTYPFAAGANPDWSKMVSSITLTTPYLPYGWYQFRTAANSQFSKGYMVFVSSPPPSGTVGPVTADNSSITTSNISWQWTQGTVSGADSYALFSAGDNVALGVAPLAPSPSFTTTNMRPNTGVALKVAGFNMSGYGDFTQSGRYYTLAAVPAALTITSATFTSVSLKWDANDNTDYTNYEISMSADNFTNHVSTPVPFSINYTTNNVTIPDLSPGFEYNFRIRAQNGAGVPTAFYPVAVSTITIGTPANLGGIATSPSSIRWTWDYMPGVTQYKIYSSIGEFLSNVAQPSNGSPFFDHVHLSTNTSYFINVQALLLAPPAINIVSTLVQSPTVYTLADQPSPYPLGPVQVTTGSIKGIWLPNNNPKNTNYSVELSLKNDFSAVSSTASATQQEFAPFVSTSFYGLTPNTSYYMRVQPVNGDGIKGNYVTISTGIYTNAQAVATQSFKASTITASSAVLYWNPQSNPSYTEYQIRYSTDGIHFSEKAGFIESLTGTTTLISELLTATSYYFTIESRSRNGNVSTGVPLTPYYIVTLTGPGGTPTGFVSGPSSSGTITGTLLSGRDIKVVVPQDSFPVPTEIAVGESTANPCGSGLPALSVYTTNDQQPYLPVQLTFGYSTITNPDELAGLDKNTIVLARFNPVTGECLKLQTSVKTTPKEITAVTNHFSLFQLIQATSPGNLENVLIYPNPFYPNRGNGYVTFENIPLPSTVKIYTLSGEKVWETAKTTQSEPQWYGFNSYGQQVASGVYLVVVNGGGNKKIFKLAVEK